MDVGSDVDQLVLKFLLLPRLFSDVLLVSRMPTRNLRVRCLLTYVTSKHQLYHSSNTVTATKTHVPTAARRVSAATRKVQQGHVRKAVDALTQPGMLEITIETLEQLQKLHPDASDPLSPDDIEFASKQAKHG